MDEDAFRGIKNLPGDGTQQLRLILDAADSVLDSEVGIEIVRTWYEVNVDGLGRSLADYIYVDLWELNSDLATRAAILFGQSSFFDPADPVPNIALQQGAIAQLVQSDGLNRAINKSANPDTVQCVVTCVPGIVGGSVQLTNGSTCTAECIRSEKDLQVAFRTLLLRACDAEDEFFRHIPRSFPRLILHEDVSIRKFSRSYAAVVPDLVLHLAFLNDEFLGLAERCNWDIVQMMGHAPVRFSDESSATKANNRVIRQRDVIWQGKSIRCTLHTKLLPTADRIHFHPPSRDVPKDRILVGIFVGHLDT